ncbi:MAG: DNA translocase FtsK, partial [Bacteroidaceae bacterium]
YHYPTLDLMKRYENSEPNINMAEQTENKDRIIDILRSFGIEISTIKATVGPTITLYEITPESGVRISKIRNLEDDIALSLKALGIRIIAPIPGKGTIGIEVPNSDAKIVPMQSVIGSKKFQESTYDLPIAFGKTITNEVFMVDLCKMPHVLVAGATGQGKSVGLNAIITSLLYKKHPAELKFVLIDPKKVEFSIYSTIEKHFLAKLPDGEDAIITDFTKVVQTLNSLCVEMDTRYDLLKKAHVRNIKEYNTKFIGRRLNPEKGHKFMPYIVVVIDEFGDLIMTAGKEVELPIARIAQLARAVGIHMIIATQRPTTNIITGTIKANFPARVAFRVSSMMDSRTILDRPGANQLIGRGDMLFLQGSDPVRVQCAFVDTPEVEQITNFISRQQGYTTAFYLPEYVSEESDSSVGEVDMNRLDPMFEDAARLIVIHQQGSTSLIQRKFSIGYNRAGRIMDQLEKAGIVGSSEGSKARQVLCMDENDLEMRLNNLQQ